MALIQCPQCGQRISDRAAACPHCGKKKQSKKKLWIFAGCGVLAVLIIIGCLLVGNSSGVEHEVKSILEDDLGTSIDISELYYNEEEQGCFVKFKIKSSRDEAAVRLDTKKSTMNQSSIIILSEQKNSDSRTLSTKQNCISAIKRYWIPYMLNGGSPLLQ